MGREEVARHQRARLYGAMIEAIDRQGYAATTVAQVIALAGVSRRAFYEQFANKEDCFLATYDITVGPRQEAVLEGWMGERGWDNRMHRSCQASSMTSSRPRQGRAPGADRRRSASAPRPRTVDASRRSPSSGVLDAGVQGRARRRAAPAARAEGDRRRRSPRRCSTGAQRPRARAADADRRTAGLGQAYRSPAARIGAGAEGRRRTSRPTGALPGSGRHAPACSARSCI